MSEQTTENQDKISDYAKKAEAITAEQLAKTEALLAQNQETLSSVNGSASQELEQQMSQLFERVNDELVKALSGGNQQKVVVAREVDIGRKVIIFDQPTRGLDLGAIDYVHKTILAERDRGKCVLLISTELSEIFTLSDRIGVLYNGRLLRIINREDADIETIGMLMAGYEPREGYTDES